MAFVTSFTAPALRAQASSICGARVSSTPAPAPARAPVTMAVSESVPAPAPVIRAISESVPFLPSNPALDGLVGSVHFDPLGLSDEMNIRWLQEAEIKHGRVCMLAIVGLIVPDFIHLPAEAFSYTLPSEAFFAVPKGGLAQIFLFCGLCELIGHRGRVTYEDFDGSRVPGDLGFNPFNIKYDEAMRLREIKNGRLAIVACSGLLHQIMIYKIGVVAGLSGLPTYPL